MPKCVAHNPIVAKSLEALRECLAQLKDAALSGDNLDMPHHLIVDSADLMARDLSALAGLARGIKGMSENAARCRYSELWLDRTGSEPEMPLDERMAIARGLDRSYAHDRDGSHRNGNGHVA